MLRCLFIVVLFFSAEFVSGQEQRLPFLTPSDTLHNKRFKTVVISEASLIGVTLIGLNELWYSDYERSSFRTINDSNEWLQMDKLGHAFSTYQLARLGSKIMAWSGASQRQRLVNGALIGFGFLTTVEVFDGFSKEWGFSWSDMGANAMGTSLFIGQELLWNEQRIALKYSFHQTHFADLRPNKLGNGLTEEFLKDYNGQTYWLSFNVQSFFKDSKIPKWINVAFGYGATGLLSGSSETFPELKNERIREYYLSFDIDLERIKTNSKLLKTLFSTLNVIKLPFPTLKINGRGRVNTHAFYF